MDNTNTSATATNMLIAHTNICGVLCDQHFNQLEIKNLTINRSVVRKQ